MNKDVECPYCDNWQEINHDDGYGYEEDELYEQECNDCGKIFVYTTSITYYYEATKADCLNGGEHNLKPVEHSPKIFPNWLRCIDCGYEEKGTINLRPFYDYKEGYEIGKTYICVSNCPELDILNEKHCVYSINNQNSLDLFKERECPCGNVNIWEELK